MIVASSQDSRSPLLRGEWLHAWLDAVPSHAAENLDRCLIVSLDTLRLPLCRVPIDQASEVLERLAARSSDPLIGIHLAESGNPSDLFSYLMAAQPCLSDSLDQFVRFGELLLSRSSIELKKEAGSRCIVLWPSLSDRHRQVTEATLRRLCLILREIGEAAPRLTAIHLRGRPRASVEEYERAFAARVLFDQPFDGISLPESELERRSRRPNPNVAALLTDVASREHRIQSSETVRERVRIVLRSAFEDGKPHLREAVAEELACPARAMQRALALENTTFTEVLEETRREEALRDLERGVVNVAALADKLGFSDKTAFCRAFKRWTGDSPVSFQRRLTPPGKD